MSNILAFTTSGKSDFLVFGVSNAKYQMPNIWHLTHYCSNYSPNKIAHT